MERILPEITKRGILVGGIDVKPTLQKHQENANWDFKEEAGFWYGVGKEMDKRFFNGLVYPDGKKVPAPVIAFDNLRNKNTLACYDLYPDEYGIIGKITFNTEHYENRDTKKEWQLGRYGQGETLLHEYVHLWQQIGRGKDPYSYAKHRRDTHNKEFVAFSEQLGIHPMPTIGCHTEIATVNSPIDILLREFGISRPEGYFSSTEWTGTGGIKKDWFRPDKGTGRSSLTKWECECVPPQRARVGKSEFFAVCPKCRESFTKK